MHLSCAAKIATAEPVRRDPDRDFLINLGREQGRQPSVGFDAAAVKQALEDFPSPLRVQAGPTLAPNGQKGAGRVAQFAGVFQSLLNGPHYGPQNRLIAGE